MISWKTATAIVLALVTATAAHAENADHLRQLLSTKECVKCNLTNAGLVLGNLVGANLNQANLSGANLSQANLAGANLRGANLSGTSLYGADLTGADLTGATLTGTDLREAYLAGANLTAVNLQTTYLQGAIGIPITAGNASDFFKWGCQELQKNNYVGAISQFNQAIHLDSEYANAYFGRAQARFKLQDDMGATADALQAEKLYKAQADQKGVLASQRFVQSIQLSRQPSQPSQGGGGSFVDIFNSVGSLLLGLF